MTDSSGRIEVASAKSMQVARIDPLTAKLAYVGKESKSEAENSES